MSESPMPEVLMLTPEQATLVSVHAVKRERERSQQIVIDEADVQRGDGNFALAEILDTLASRIADGFEATAPSAQEHSHEDIETETSGSESSFGYSEVTESADAEFERVQQIVRRQRQQGPVGFRD